MARSVFGRKFGQNIKRVEKRRIAYLADPENEKNIHDIRTSIRRLDATFSLLPKRVRGRMRHRVEKYRQFLKGSSAARDCDIIASRIGETWNLDTSDLQKKKKVVLARATLLARSLKQLPAVKLDAKDDKRVMKVVDRLIEKIGKALPPVLSDASKVKELHRLRKAFRKLRYVLELLSPADRKKYIKSASRAVHRMIRLEELQALLGVIHDCDVTIEYLRSRSDTTWILNKELITRQQLYNKFVRYMKK